MKPHRQLHVRFTKLSHISVFSISMDLTCVCSLVCVNWYTCVGINIILAHIANIVSLVKYDSNDQPVKILFRYCSSWLFLFFLSWFSSWTSLWYINLLMILNTISIISISVTKLIPIQRFSVPPSVPRKVSNSRASLSSKIITSLDWNFTFTCVEWEKLLITMLPLILLMC